MKELNNMNFNRKTVTRGLVGLGLVGAFVTGGVVAAQAATGEGPIPQPVSTAPSSVGAGPYGHMAGMAFGQNSPMTVVASYLGLSQTELQEKMQAGKSLADVAKTAGKSVSGLEDAMVAALQTNLEHAGALTSDQKAATVEELRTRIDAMVNAAHTPGTGMAMGSASGAGMGMQGANTDSRGNPGMGSGMARAAS
ncbi:hypothetical protein [Cryobacterium zhongshanensis]|uniref:DUF2680 domain-containing protein n=1 Tax=Cryobacterium zhongshanensis TaxID=2928153 RepID=A0AA41UHN5_9MICO|nr:hypothetical protein [Cryobacterium zhongshanensis]MCI4660080.1 hypothetical protein [Cryobacterium zhongshanensis]